MAGFGDHEFGNSYFGVGSYAQDILVAPFPKEYYQQGEKNKDEPLGHFLASMGNGIDKRRNEIDEMESFMAPLECPSGLIKYIADAIAVGVDDYEPETFQRSITNNAVQYYTLKGTAQAYQIRGLMSGFEVTVQTLWYVEPYIAAQIPGESLLEVPPDSGQFLSRLPPQEVSGVSATIPYYGNCEFCLTAFVGIDFELKKVPPQGFPLNILDRIIDKIKEIMPIHVRELYVQLELNIDVDMAMEVDVYGEEESYRNVGFNYRYDLWPSDVVPSDIGLNITGDASST